MPVSCGDDDRICRKTLVSSVFDSRFSVMPGLWISALFCMLGL